MTEPNTAAFLPDAGGSQPRAIVLFCDLVGSTELSGRHEPERYGLLVRRYITKVRTTIEGQFGGHVASEAGDGLLALFGALHAHGDDAERAVRAALEVVDRIRGLSVETERELGESLSVRIGVHRGPIYRTADGAVYGLTVNVAARLQTLAAPNTVVVSDEVQRMVDHLFEFEAAESNPVKGIEQALRAHRVVGEWTNRPLRHELRSHLIDRDAEWDRLRAAVGCSAGGDHTSRLCPAAAAVRPAWASPISCRASLSWLPMTGPP